jgi:carbon-monoxide dehydrogenase medium subunit
MYAFTLERPTTVADAAKLAAAGAKPLAGGQTLLASMKLRLSAPEQLVDLSGIKELTGIRKDGSTITIGAMSRHLDVANNADVKAAFPALADLASRIATGRCARWAPSAAQWPTTIRQRATRARCWGRRDGRHVQARDCRRRFLPGPVHHGAGRRRADHRHPLPIPKRAVYEKLRQKASNFPLVGIFLTQSDSGVRVAVTGAGNGVFRHTGLEDALNKSFTAAAAAAVKIDASDLNSDLHASAAYRANLISVLTQRAVTKALG